MKKKLAFLLLFVGVISLGVNLWNPISGSLTRNVKYGEGIQVTDTLLTKGLNIFEGLAGSGAGVATLDNNGKVGFGTAASISPWTSSDTNVYLRDTTDNVLIKDTLVISSGAESGKVLKSDATGVATWQNVEPYLVYTALLTQTDTFAPIATVLRNTLGGTPVWSYNDVGQFTAALTGAFIVNKTGLIPGNPNDGDLSTPKYILGGGRSSDNEIIISVFDTNSSTTSNDALTNTFIEIRVYP